MVAHGMLAAARVKFAPSWSMDHGYSTGCCSCRASYERKGRAVQLQVCRVRWLAKPWVASVVESIDHHGRQAGRPAGWPANWRMRALDHGVRATQSDALTD